MDVGLLFDPSRPEWFGWHARGRRILSAPWVMQGVQFLHTLAGDVRVDLRRREITVAEEHLHDTQIRAVVQQVRRESVAQSVR